MLSRATVQTAFLGCILAFPGCKSESPPPSPAAPSANPVPVGARSVPEPAPAAASPPRSFQVPTGPRLAILAGEGVGPIRFGATVATIERLMDGPCELKTADKCRYIAQAIEFELKDGVVNRMVIHRHERPAGPDAQGKPQIYGFFNGGIPPDLGFGMIPKAIKDVIGPPASVEKVTVQNDFNTVERDTYPGMVLEYDRYTNGNLILGGVVLTKAKTNPTPGIPSGKQPLTAVRPVK